MWISLAQKLSQVCFAIKIISNVLNLRTTKVIYCDATEVRNYILGKLTKKQNSNKPHKRVIRQK